jgi:hypothetical protein
MKAIPMRGRLTGKRIAGFLWAGRGKSWQRKENYFQLEHSQLCHRRSSDFGWQFLGGCVPSLVEKEKWRNLLLTQTDRR